MEMPATCARVKRASEPSSLLSPLEAAREWRTWLSIGTPASARASEAAHADAIDDDPFDAVTSHAMRTVYGKSLTDERDARHVTRAGSARIRQKGNARPAKLVP